MQNIDITNPPCIQEVTTAQLKHFVGFPFCRLSDMQFEDLVETTGFDPARLLPGGKFRSQSNCDGTHFLVHDGPREVVWPPKKEQQ